MQKNIYTHLKEVGGDVLCLPIFQKEKNYVFQKQNCQKYVNKLYRLRSSIQSGFFCLFVLRKL